jgi:ligand-binding sensor domain-containing protein
MVSRGLYAVLGLVVFLGLSCSDDDNPVTSPDDTVAPSAIIDLAAGDPTGASITLTWTAPGDDGGVAKAREYDIRYSTTPITSSSFESATAVPDPLEPTVGGEEQSFTVTGLSSNTTYYFAIRTADEVPNWSELSNVVSARTHLAGNWIVYTAAGSGIPSDMVSDVAVQSVSNVYLATPKGLAHYDDGTWTTYDTANSGIVSENLTVVVIDGDGVKWIGSQNEGASRFDGAEFINYIDTNSGLAAGAISSVAVGDAGQAWFGTASGLFLLEGGLWASYNAPDDLSFNGIGSLAFDASGDLWVGYDLYGASRFDGAAFEHFDAGDGFTSLGVSSMAVDGTGIWFGTEQGAYVYDGSGWTAYSTSNSELPHDVVLEVMVDGVGHKWFGTENGLTRFTGSSWVTYNTQNSGLPDNTVLALAVDPEGRIWIGTPGGLAVFSD